MMANRVGGKPVPGRIMVLRRDFMLVEFNQKLINHPADRS